MVRRHRTPYVTYVLYATDDVACYRDVTNTSGPIPEGPGRRSVGAGDGNRTRVASLED